MVCSWSTVVRSAALALLMAAGLGGVAARAQNGGAAADTNAGPTIPGKGVLQTIKEDVFGPLDQYGPKSAIDGVMNPVPRKRLKPPLRPDAATKETRDKQRDWIFSDLNDLNSPPTVEELMGLPQYGPDGREKKKIPPMERYFQELDSKQNPAPGSNYLTDMMDLMMGAKESSGTNGMSSMSFFLPGLNEPMKGVTPAKSGDSTGKDDSAAGFLGPAPAADPAAVLNEKRHRDEFNRTLNHDVPAPAGPASSFSSFSELLKPPPAPKPAGVPAGLPAMPQPFQSGFAPAAGFANSAAPGFRPSGGGATMPGFSGPGATRSAAPQPAPPPRQIPVDPFKDNLPKRSF